MNWPRRHWRGTPPSFYPSPLTWYFWKVWTKCWVREKWDLASENFLVSSFRSSPNSVVLDRDLFMVVRFVSYSFSLFLDVEYLLSTWGRCSHSSRQSPWGSTGIGKSRCTPFPARILHRHPCIRRAIPGGHRGDWMPQGSGRNCNRVCKINLCESGVTSTQNAKRMHNCAKKMHTVCDKGHSDIMTSHIT